MQEVPETPNHDTTQEVYYRDAIELTELLQRREVSAQEVMNAFLERINTVNPLVNAICTLRPKKELMQEAKKCDETAVRGPLHGIPIAVKDLALTKGIRTTYGSPIYEKFIPEQDTLFVERLKKAGAIVIGKTNTPEFGAGSHTFNTLFGVTRNPYDLTRTAGGSSGGAAAALAAGMVPVADGSDLGGSLRNPAGYCNIVGFRPSVGRVPGWPTFFTWDSMATEGPMGRTVQDVALLLSVMAGPDPRMPLSIEQPASCFRDSLKRDFKNVPIAWSTDLGCLPVEPEMIQVCENALTGFKELGAAVTPAHPDCKGAFESFQTLRGYAYTSLESDYRQHRELMKDTVVWNIEKGLGLTAPDLARAEWQRSCFYHRVREFLEEYEFLVLPTAQVTPFPVEQEWVREINGIKLENYIDWMAVCCIISLTGLPAISVPCGFTAKGLPVGLQIVGRHHADMSVLQLAHAFEQATNYNRIRPQIPTDSAVPNRYISIE
jgi:amidase